MTELELKEQKVFKLIYDYIYETYGVSYVSRDTNIYQDLNFTEFQKYDLFDYIKKELQIKEIPLIYFSSIGVLSNIVAEVLIKTEMEQKQLQKQKELRQQRLKNSKTYQAIMWLKTKFNGK